MKLRHLLMCCAVVAFAGCENNEPDMGSPALTLTPAELNMESGAGSQTITLNATRPWKVVIPETVDWISVDPETGGASLDDQNVTVSVLKNTGNNRSGEIQFTIGTITKALTVKQDGEQGEVETGEGTLESPYSPSGALAVIAGLAADVQTAEVYIKGIVSNVRSIDTGYGNAEYDISDDGKNENALYVYRGYYLGGAKFTSTDQLKVGDEVLILGKLVNFKGNTPEVTTGSKIITLNGEEAGENPGNPDIEPLPTEGAIYYNDFDKTEVSANTSLAANVDAYKNETGSGASAVNYSWDGVMSVRTSAPSDGSKTSISTNYAGSGVNSIFFGNQAGSWFAINNIAINTQNLVLRFGVSDGNAVLNPAEFHVYAGNAAGAWIELQYTFPNDLVSKTWDMASVVFSVPAGMNAINFKFVSDILSTHRLDDVILSASETAGDMLDFGSAPKTFTVSPLTLNVASDATSATFDVKGDVAWTAVSDNSAFTVSPASGNGDGTVTVSFAANTGSEARTAKIKVSTTENVSVSEYTVNVTQAAAGSASSGTAENPYTVAEALNVINAMPADTPTTDDVYVKGIIVSVTEISVGYGNATYYISDDGTAANQLYVYRGYYLDGEKFTSADQIKTGDQVVVCGKLVNFKGNTPEIQTSNKLYSINGKTQDDTKKFGVSQTSLSVSASETSATFNVTGNVAWTATSDSGEFTVSPASGSGNGTVTVSFAANTGSEARTAKIKVSTTEDVATKEYTVTITQKGKPAEGVTTYTDVLDNALTGRGTQTSYGEWSGKKGTESDAVYAGQSAGSYGSIQLRSQSPAGIVTTASGGVAKKVVVEWNSNTSSSGNRTLDVYGLHTAYSSSADLYNTSSATQGTKLGTITCGTATELVINGDYEYIGLRSNNGAMYIDKITITWEK